MKKTILAATLLSIVACSQEPAVNMKLQGTTNDTLLVTTYPVSDRTMKSTDTIIGNAGTYVFPNKAEEIQMMQITAKLEEGSRSLSLPLVPGTVIELEGSFDDYQIRGNEFFKEYSAFLDSLRPLDNAMRKAMAEVTRLQKAKAPMDSIRKAYDPMRELSIAKSQINFKYIESHPDSDVSVWLLQQLSMQQTAQALEGLTERAKTGMMADVYNSVKERLEQEKKRKENALALTEGKPAPEITGLDIEGNEVSLSRLRGKYVVIDFWGTWCGWCIKGMPEMKATYEKAKENFEFIGIACNDPEDKWRNKVDELQLPWINLLNSTRNDISVAYGVSAFPTKFIIDPEGNIALKVVGESPVFYDFIENVLNPSQER